MEPNWMSLAVAGTAFSLWLPAGMMLAGAGLLGLLVYLSMRERRDVRNGTISAAHLAEELDRLKRAGDRAALLTAAAEKAADALDERIANLEQLLSQVGDDASAQRESVMAQRVTAATAIDVEPKPAVQTVVVDPFTQAVYDLADAGRTPVEIAGELKEHTGKIELILNLRGIGTTDGRG